MQSVTDDVSELMNVSHAVRHLVDTRIAHSDRNPMPADELPTYPDLDEDIDVIGRLYQRYCRLLNVRPTGLHPVTQGDWTAVFRQPWLAD